MTPTFLLVDLLFNLRDLQFSTQRMLNTSTKAVHTMDITVDMTTEKPYMEPIPSYSVRPAISKFEYIEEKCYFKYKSPRMVSTRPHILLSSWQL